MSYRAYNPEKTKQKTPKNHLSVCTCVHACVSVWEAGGGGIISGPLKGPWEPQGGSWESPTERFSHLGCTWESHAAGSQPGRPQTAALPGVQIYSLVIPRNWHFYAHQPQVIRLHFEKPCLGARLLLQWEWALQLNSLVSFPSGGCVPSLALWGRGVGPREWEGIVGGRLGSGENLPFMFLRLSIHLRNLRNVTFKKHTDL